MMRSSSESPIQPLGGLLFRSACSFMRYQKCPQYMPNISQKCISMGSGLAAKFVGSHLGWLMYVILWLCCPCPHMVFILFFKMHIISSKGGFWDGLFYLILGEGFDITLSSESDLVSESLSTGPLSSSGFLSGRLDCVPLATNSCHCYLATLTE